MAINFIQHQNKRAVIINMNLKKLNNIKYVLIGLILPISILIFWLSVGWFKLASPGLVPTPVSVYNALLTWNGIKISAGSSNLFYYNTFNKDFYVTFIRLASGFVLASFLGVLAGIGIGMNKFIDSFFTPIFRILGPVPPITIFPLAIVIFGLGDQTNIFLTFYGAFFPIMAASIASVSSVSRDYLRVGRMLGYGSIMIISKIVLPAALPGIAGSLRIGLGLAWMMEITSEMMGVHSGLGYTLWNAYNYFDYPAVYACMITIGLLGLFTDVLVRLITRKLLYWHDDIGIRG
ncbi:ABC transporter permease [Acidithiobacillus thiooxidans]|uniref:ABC transporter permease n=1 Tax=Acidithiobacillus thiooxidans TaxID=930 RepID=UPI001C073B19|nr:ABC transporter permease [Acidithiobacillus thiooxidans]MBU2837889.1 ABC transporter permease [Acidithiobacillus thiooxidans]